MQISITVVSKLQTQLQDLINTKFLIFALFIKQIPLRNLFNMLFKTQSLRLKTSISK
jgi:hypothetical protein